MNNVCVHVHLSDIRMHVAFILAAERAIDNKTDYKCTMYSVHVLYIYTSTCICSYIKQYCMHA